VLTSDHTVLPATHTFIHKWNEPYLPLLPSRRASAHFGWYSFPVPLRVGGWVGLGGMVKYWGGLPAEDGQTSTNWARRRVTSLIRQTTLPLRHAATESAFLKQLYWISLNLTTITTPQPFYGPFSRDHPGEPVPEENFWTLCCKGRLKETHTDHPAGCHSIRTNQCPPPPSPPFLQVGWCLCCRPTNSVKALKATSVFGLGWRR